MRAGMGLAIWELWSGPTDALAAVVAAIKAPAAET
jgi:hypothetical protein